MHIYIKQDQPILKPFLLWMHYIALLEERQCQQLPLPVLPHVLLRSPPEAPQPSTTQHRRHRPVSMPQGLQEPPSPSSPSGVPNLPREGLFPPQTPSWSADS